MISTKELIFIKESIEWYTNADPEITDVIINFQVRKYAAHKNFLKLDIKK